MTGAVRGAFARAAAAALAFLLGSCADAFAPLLLRTYDDPFQDVARAECFTTVNTIYLSWSADAGADEYILMRADDVRPYRFSQVYRGKGTAYADTFDAMTAATDRYLYRLDKVRGQKRFEGRRHAYGMRARIFGGADAYGDNDEEGRAVQLETDRIDVMPCWQFTDGTLIIDADWYYVELKARRKATLVLEHTTGNISYAEGAATPFRCIAGGGTEKEIRNKSAFTIVNETDGERKITFRLHADATSLFPLGAGSTVLSYALSLKTITAYP